MGGRVSGGAVQCGVLADSLVVDEDVGALEVSV